MAKIIGTATLKDSPPHDRLQEREDASNLSASRSVDQSSHSIPHFNLLDPTPEDRKRRWLALGFSPAVEALAVCLVVWALMEMPHQPELKFAEQKALMFHLATPAPPIKRPPTLLREPPMARLTAAPVVPAMRRAEAPKPELQRLKTPKISQPRIELPEPAPAPATFASVRMPSRPARRQITPVRTGAFSPGSAAAQTIKRPLREVQTGGFGATNGIPGNPQEDSHAKIASLGAFDLPQGAGYGNGTGGARGVRGTVASAGFGNAEGSPQGKSSPASVRQSGFGNAVDGRQNASSPGNVRQGGFGSVVAGAKAPPSRSAAREANFEPVVILSKPNPIYPAEARRLHLEGDVILNVVFEASGKVDVLKVVKGLGHGMDQAAVQAAENIRFKPAQRGGRPVNSEAMLHIIFQLAY